MLLLLLACGAPETPGLTWCHATGEAFGTTWNVRWSESTCNQPAIDGVLDEIDRGMSTWREDSEISQVRTGGRHAVSVDTEQVVRAALTLAERTGGAFDPTVQPLMEVWGFHGSDRKTPTPEALQAARDQVGWSRVSVGPGWVDAGGTALDLSAIAKGHAVDRVFHALPHANLMVEVGGEVRTGGEGPNGRWAIGVDAPKQGNAPGSELAAVITLTHGALATSGNYRNAVEMDGVRVHHTMDPRTGSPAVSDVASVSVVAPSCRDADGLATALMVLGSEGLSLVEALPDTEALLLVGTEAGWQQQTSSGMQRFLR